MAFLNKILVPLCRIQWIFEEIFSQISCVIGSIRSLSRHARHAIALVFGIASSPQELRSSNAELRFHWSTVKASYMYQSNEIPTFKLLSYDLQRCKSILDPYYRWSRWVIRSGCNVDSGIVTQTGANFGVNVPIRWNCSLLGLGTYGVIVVRQTDPDEYGGTKLENEGTMLRSI